MDINKRNMEDRAGRADLHVHTIYSDGLLHPAVVVEKGVDLGLKALAITDHDCIDGIDEAVRAARGKDIEIIPGVEVSAAIGDDEIHILGYFVDRKNIVFSSALERIRAGRIIRMGKMIDALAEKGFKIDLEELLAANEKSTIGRLHLARAMVEKGYVKSLKEAFDRYIGDRKCCHVSHERLEYKDAIKLIANAGGVPVLAHPGAYGRDDHMDDYISAGLKGIEVYHSDNKEHQVKKYLKITEDKDLVVTGGSDCHGKEFKGEILLGLTTVDMEVVGKLRACAEDIRKNKK